MKRLTFLPVRFSLSLLRYVDKYVRDELLAVVEVDDGTAAGLHASVKSILKDRGIPLENIIGFGAHNCSTMMGRNSGFSTLLIDDCPNVFIMGCVCHSFALCSNAAAKLLPSWLESLLRDIGSYFSKSAKRTREFKLIQDVV
jgi:hypothetical protein